MILVDTSVWIDHLRKGNVRLRSFLYKSEVLMHPFVVGELACGSLINREEILRLLCALPEARLARHDEVLHLVQEQELYGSGIGWIDAHLLASALLSKVQIWTLDRRFKRAVEHLNVCLE